MPRGSTPTSRTTSPTRSSRSRKATCSPQIKYTRESIAPDTRYFRPHIPIRAARRMVDIARRVVPLCASSCADWRSLAKAGKGIRSRADKRCPPLLRCACGLGARACCGRITPEQYAANVSRIERFLAGQHREFLDELSEEMQRLRLSSISKGGPYQGANRYDKRAMRQTTCGKLSQS